jgi:hypothetical protein
MNRINAFYLVLAGLALNISALVPDFAQAAAAAEPKNSIEWFSRASDRMNLRMPGSAPFHLKIAFHAYPGMELLGPKEKSDFISGDGVYEETWLAPHQWRREVTLAGYHAIEVDSNGARKMQSSSDYEPSRVLTLLDALFLPIPRNLVSKEFRHEGATGWKVKHVTTGNISLVCISKGFGDQRGDFTTAYYFQPNGNLVMTNDEGLVSLREGVVPFADKVVPKHLSIKAGDGEREMLEADLVIEAAQPNVTAFDLPGGPAEPGMTLRPLQFYEVKIPEGHNYYYRNVNLSAFSIQAVLDRTGRYREVEVLSAPHQKEVLSAPHQKEVLSAPNQKEVKALSPPNQKMDAGLITNIMNSLRHDHFKAPLIDGVPCEFLWVESVM